MRELDYELQGLKGDDRLTIAHLDAPPEVLLLLARDPDPVVREEVARNRNTPLEALSILAEDPEWRVRLAVVQEATPEHPHREGLEGILVHLLEDEDFRVRREAAARVHTFDPRWLEDPALRKGFATNRAAPPDLLRHLAKDEDWNVRIRVSGNPATPAETLRDLAGHYLCEAEVAGNPSCPEDLLFTLLERGACWVKRAIARNRIAPPEVLKGLAEAGFRKEVAENPGTPEEHLRELARNRDPEVRKAVARNPKASAELLSQLGRDKNWEVRLEVARRRDAPKEVIVELLNDPYLDVFRAACHNPSCPKEALAHVLAPLQVALRMGAQEFVAYALENLEEVARNDRAFLRLLLHLEHAPQDAGLWLKIGELAGKRRVLLRLHPFGRQIWTLFALAS